MLEKMRRIIMDDELPNVDLETLELQELIKIKNLVNSKIEEKTYKEPFTLVDAPPLSILATLKNPDLFNMITEKEMDKKIVGEIESRKTIFLCAAGGRLVKNAKFTSYNLMVNDEAGVGKDYVVTSTLEMVPKEFRIKRTRISEKVLTYWHNEKIEPLWTWDGKVFYVEDISQAFLNSDVFKVFSSSGTSATVLIKQRPVDVIVKGKPVQIITSAKAEPNDQNLRRFPILNLDSGVDQTKAVIRCRAKFAKEGMIPEYDEELINAQGYLKRVDVKIDFADMISEYFCQKKELDIIMRTNFDRFLDYIKACAALYQYQRKTDNEGYILAESQDYDIARICILKLTSNSRMIPLTKDDQRILSTMKTLPETEDGYSVSELEEHITFLSDKWLRVKLNLLAEKRFLNKGSKISKDTNRRGVTYSLLPQGLISIPTFAELQDFHKQYSSTINTKATTSDTTFATNSTISTNDITEKT